MLFTLQVHTVVFLTRGLHVTHGALKSGQGIISNLVKHVADVGNRFGFAILIFRLGQLGARGGAVVPTLGFVCITRDVCCVLFVGVKVGLKS